MYLQSSRHLKYGFTLIEIIVVISIMAIILTLAVVKLARPPAAALVEDSAQSIRALLFRAKMRAAAKGCKTYLLYDSEKRKFYVTEDLTADSEVINAAESKYLVYIMPEDIEFSNTSDDENVDEHEDDNQDKSLPKIPDYSTNNHSQEVETGDAQVIYSFSPGGAGFGSDMKVKMRGHIRIISCSQLTGIIRVKEPRAEDADV